MNPGKQCWVEELHVADMKLKCFFIKFFYIYGVLKYARSVVLKSFDCQLKFKIDYIIMNFNSTSRLQ